MLAISFETENLIFRDITKEHLDDVLNLYNQNQENMYATGIDHRMSLKDISEKYLEVLVNSHEFFTGIFKQDGFLVGVVKGRIDYENTEEAWISSILIDKTYQRQGLGSRIIEALIKQLSQHYDIKRVFIGILSGNHIGKNFWQKLGFNYLRTIEQYMRLNNHYEDFIIMKKEI